MIIKSFFFSLSNVGVALGKECALLISILILFILYFHSDFIFTCLNLVNGSSLGMLTSKISHIQV